MYKATFKMGPSGSSSDLLEAVSRLKQAQTRLRNIKILMRVVDSGCEFDPHGILKGVPTVSFSQTLST